MKHLFWTKTCAVIAIGALMQPMYGVAQQSLGSEAAEEKGMVEVAPRSSDAVAKMTLSVESSPYLSKEEKLTLLKKR